MYKWNEAKVIATLALYTLHVGAHRPVAGYSKSFSSDYCGHDPIQNQVATSAGNSKNIYIKGDTTLSTYLVGGTQTVPQHTTLHAEVTKVG